MKQSPVIHLQTSCMRDDVSATSLLLQAKAIASKLGKVDLIDWINNELNGYSVSIGELPSYRNFNGSLCVWSDNKIEYIEPLPEKVVNLVKMIGSADSVSSIELSAKKSEPVAFPMPVTPHWQSKIKSMIRNHPGIDRKFLSIVVSGNYYISVLTNVKSIVLDWALELEKNGIFGEDLIFSPSEVWRATEMKTIIINGNVQNAGDTFGGTQINNQINISEIKSNLRLEIGKALSLASDSGVVDVLESIRNNVDSNEIDKFELSGAVSKLGEYAASGIFGGAAFMAIQQMVNMIVMSV